MEDKKIIYTSDADKLVLEQYKVEAEILGLTLTEYLLFQVLKEMEQIPGVVVYE